MALKDIFTPNNHQWFWDATSLTELMRCPERYRYNIRDGYRYQDSNSSLSPRSRILGWGGAIHECLAVYDLGARTPEALRAALRRAIELLADWPEPESKAPLKERGRTLYTLIRAIVWYAAHYRDDQLQIPDEQDLIAEVMYCYPLDMDTPDGHQVYIGGFFDRLTLLNDQWYVLERKHTTSSLSQYWFDDYDPNPQVQIYDLAGQIVLQDRKCRGLIVDGIQTAIGFTRFARQTIASTPARREETLRDICTLITDQFRYQQTYYPLNRTACGIYGGCPYRSICRLDPAMRERFLKHEYVQDRWNPLEREDIQQAVIHD